MEKSVLVLESLIWTNPLDSSFCQIWAKGPDFTASCERSYCRSHRYWFCWNRFRCVPCFASIIIYLRCSLFCCCCRPCLTPIQLDSWFSPYGFMLFLCKVSWLALKCNSSLLDIYFVIIEYPTLWYFLLHFSPRVGRPTCFTLGEVGILCIPVFLCIHANSFSSSKFKQFLPYLTD